MARNRRGDELVTKLRAGMIAAALAVSLATQPGCDRKYSDKPCNMGGAHFVRCPCLVDSEGKPEEKCAKAYLDKMKGGPSKTEMQIRTNTRVVRDGESVISAEELKASGITDMSVYSWKVKAIDVKGIELAPIDLASATAYIAPGNTPSLRIDYGKERRIGEGALVMSVQPKHCGSPETVMVSYSYSVPK